MDKLIRNIFNFLAPVAIMLVLLSCQKPQMEINELPTPVAAKETEETINITNDTHSSLKVNFINVGKADCTLISYDDKNYLIDTGHVSSLNKVVQVLVSEGIDTLDAIYITHIHDDHIGGLQGLFEMMNVDKVYFPDITDFDKNGDNVVIDLCSQYHKELIRTKTGDIHVLSNDEEVYFEVVGPITHSKEENDNSLVMYLNYYDKSILFTGDMQFTEEETLIQANKIHTVDILKAGNHGNADAGSMEFVDITEPMILVVPTDKDIFAKDINDSISYLLKKTKKAYITNDFKNGIEFKLTGAEILTNDYKVKVQDASGLIEISYIDHKAELITITNKSNEDVNLDNWWVYSRKGDETYFIPKGTIIKSNERLTISSGDTPPQANLFWTKDNVWKKDDKAILYSNRGIAEAIYDLKDK